jgi:hypothetical protein
MSNLYRAVPPSRWCVNREDLVSLRHKVERAIRDARIHSLAGDTN